MRHWLLLAAALLAAAAGAAQAQTFTVSPDMSVASNVTLHGLLAPPGTGTTVLLQCGHIVLGPIGSLTDTGNGTATLPPIPIGPRGVSQTKYCPDGGAAFVSAPP